MKSTFVEIDFQNLMDSCKIASERGGRIRLSDQEAVSLFCMEEGIDLSWSQIFATKQELPMATILTSGLMRGFYLYSLDEERAFRYVASTAETRPLRSYSKAMEFDLALSYASEDRSDVVLPLARQLEKSGTRVYVLDVAEDPSDPLWGVRFREAVFHSYYFVPLLGPQYLARSGTANELFDLARMTVEHRADEFFYPLIPLVNSMNALSRVFTKRGAVSRALDERSFKWLRTHIMPVGLDRGVPWLSAFFTSLAKNAKGVFDAGFLHCLKSDIEWVEFFSFSNDRRMARLLIKNPLLTYYIYDAKEDGIFRFSGLGEAQENASAAADHADVVRAVLDHLGLPS